MPFSPAKLAAEIRAAEISQAELAREAGITPVYISRLTTGRRDDPSANVLQRIARVLRIKVDDLMGD